MRSYVAKFRISAHKLPIKTYRYVSTERQNRICTVCQRDELHYFSKCNNALLKVCREKYINHIKKRGERSSLFKETNIAMCALMFHDDTIKADTANSVKQLVIILDLLATDQI